MDPAVAALQNAINRFAVVGGFPRVTVDGFWGPQTKQGVYSALTFIGQGKCYQTACPDAETAKTAAGVMAEWNESINAVRGLTEFIGGVADELGLPLVATPIPGSGVKPPSSVPIVRIPAFQVSLVDRFKTLPLWQQVTLGVLAGIGLIFVVNRVQAARAPTRRKRG